MPLHHSPVIRRLLQEIAGLKKPKVLDLGATSTSMLQFFAERKCKLYFEDLPASLFEAETNCAAAAPNASIDQHLLDYGDTRFDLVLGWDLLNYLDLDAVTMLMDKINRHCRPDTLFHMIRYSGSRIPARPRRFRLHTAQTLKFEPGDIAPRRAPAHSTVRLLQHMTDQFMESTDMNEAGMQPGFVEHVLRYRPTAHARKVSVNRRQANTARSAGVPASSGFRSPGLELIYSSLSAAKDPKILIIGARPGRHYDYLAKFDGEIFIEDLFSSLQWRQSHQQRSALGSDAISYPYGTRFDAVIAWDLFNYCDHAQIEAVGDLLSRVCDDGTLLYVVSYTQNRIPARPRQFDLSHRGYIRTSEPDAWTPRKSNITAAGLIKLLPAFYVQHTFFKQSGMLNGVCEYVLQCARQHSAAARREPFVATNPAAAS